MKEPDHQTRSLDVYGIHHKVERKKPSRCIVRCDLESLFSSDIDGA
jgi:hypothetical protein